MRTHPTTPWTLAANDADGMSSEPQSVAWMGLLVGDEELTAASYRRIAVDPLRSLDTGFYEIEGRFEPLEVWDGITGLALWAQPEGGVRFYVKPCEAPISVEPGFSIQLTMRIKDVAQTAATWRSLLQASLPSGDTLAEAP